MHVYGSRAGHRSEARTGVLGLCSGIRLNWLQRRLSFLVELEDSTSSSDDKASRETRGKRSFVLSPKPSPQRSMTSSVLSRAANSLAN